MQATPIQPGRTRVLLLEPNYQLRSAILTVLGEERYVVEICDSLDRVLLRADPSGRTVALVAWQSMQGLLAEERRQDLADLTRRVRLVVFVPRHWERLLRSTDLGRLVAGFVTKPVDAEELLNKLELALAVPVADS